jgi:hypothetical protein
VKGRCGSCGRKSSGKGRIAIAMPEGKRKRVCGECARGGKLVVANGSTCKLCGGPATVCTSCCADEVVKSGGFDRRAEAKKLRDRAKAYGRAPQSGEAGEYAKGISVGISMAADIVEVGGAS